MKQINITIHPFSALAGMALLGLVLVTAGAMPLQGSSSTRDVSAIEVVKGPVPNEYLELNSGTAFTVPGGKRFILTALGGVYQNSTYISFIVNGIQKFLADPNANENTGLTLKSVPQGPHADAGEVVDISGPDGIAYGYLVDA